MAPASIPDGACDRRRLMNNALGVKVSSAFRSSGALSPGHMMARPRL